MAARSSPTVDRPRGRLTSGRDVSGFGFHVEAPALDAHLQPVPALPRDIARRVAHQVALTELVENLHERRSEILRRARIVECSAGDLAQLSEKRDSPGSPATTAYATTSERFAVSSMTSGDRKLAVSTPSLNTIRSDRPTSDSPTIIPV